MRVADLAQQVAHSIKVKIRVVVPNNAEALVVGERVKEADGLGIGRDAVGMFLVLAALAVRLGGGLAVAGDFVSGPAGRAELDLGPRGRGSPADGGSNFCSQRHGSSILPV